MRLLTDLIYLLAAALYLPFALYNALVLGKNRSGWGQRFGRLTELPPSPNRVWVHAVSLGEVNATPRLVEALRAALPKIEVVVSTTTDTGFRRAVELYGTHRVFRFPLDFSWVIRRSLNAIKPAMIVLVELEVWPNMVWEASRRGVSVVVVNGRLTQRSARRLARFGPLIRDVFSRLTWVGAQDETIAARFRALGLPAERLQITGSLKWDTAVVAGRVEGDTDLALALGIDRTQPLLVCGSTGPGEETILLNAHEKILDHRGNPRPRLIIIPRKPERFDEVARLIESRGFTCVRRSRYPNGSSPAPDSDKSVVLGDTMGELRKFYSLADLVFIGRTLVPMGGSDPMEVAALAKPILAGPHTDNFEQPVRALRDGGALVVVQSAEELASEVCRLMSDPVALKSMGRRAQEIVLANQGATGKTVERLLELIADSGPSEAHTPASSLDSSRPRHYNPASLPAPEKA